MGTVAATVAAMAVGTATGTTITTIGKVGATDGRTNWAPSGSCVFLHKDPASSRLKSADIVYQNSAGNYAFGRAGSKAAQKLRRQGW
jgi:hypothetical protein